MKRLINIDWKNNIVRYKTINAIIVSIGGLFLVMFAYFTFQALMTNQIIDDTRQEQSKLQGEISYFNLARQLTSDAVEEYNTLLLRLIPEVEDYFSIIASLERLSLYTGLDVSRYSIDLPEQGQDKFTLSIVGTVPPRILPLFLQNYQYGTGRLVTIESMTINNNEDNNINLILNFYSQEVKTSNILKVGSLAQEDIQMMQQIQQKIAQGESQAAELQRIKQEEETFVEQRRASESARLSGTPTPTPTQTPSRTPDRSVTQRP